MIIRHTNREWKKEKRPIVKFNKINLNPCGPYGLQILYYSFICLVEFSDEQSCEGWDSLTFDAVVLFIVPFDILVIRYEHKTTLSKQPPCRFLVADSAIFSLCRFRFHAMQFMDEIFIVMHRKLSVYIGTFLK